MNKKTTRAFASGLLIAALAIMGYEQIYAGNNAKEETNADYIEMKQADYEQLKQQELDAREKYETLLKRMEDDKSDIVDVESDVKRFHLRIKEGMTSKEISEELIDAGVIDDANGFNTFLAERKLQHLIQIGEYDVDSDMSFLQITEIITNEHE